MRLPAPLSRKDKKAHKNRFGHVLIVAGSQNMMGAAALTSLAAIRSGAGLVTLGIPKSLNQLAHKKISHTIMTMPLPETSKKSISGSSISVVQKNIKKYTAMAIGPGLSQNTSTQNFILNAISKIKIPTVIDADALNALSRKPGVLKKSEGTKILTPHPGEMARLTKLQKNTIEKNRKSVAQDFAKKYNCIVVLKGHNTVVASAKKTYINTTGNVGLATAGSGDVLTGMITAFLGQGVKPFEAAKLGVYLHGRAGHLAVKAKSKVSMIATDIIDNLSKVL